MVSSTNSEELSRLNNRLVEVRVSIEMLKKEKAGFNTIVERVEEIDKELEQKERELKQLEKDIDTLMYAV
jgi:uncharacterized protein YdcH (DUF465 family)